MTTAQQAEYLTANGWTRKGELWLRRSGGHFWEQSAAVKRQQYLDRVKREEKDGNSQRTIHGELRTNR